MTNADPWSARIDWPKVLEEIAYLLGDARTDNEQLRDPVSQEKLADALTAPRGTLRGWIDGSEPRHSDGERIIAFWCRLTGKARTFAPTDRFVYSAAKVSPIATNPNARNHGKANDGRELAMRLDLCDQVAKETKRAEWHQAVMRSWC